MAKSTSYVPENCKGIIDGLKALGNKHSIWNVFEDWLKVCSISISNAVDWNQANEREEQYLETINKYTPEEQKVLTKTFAELVNALQKEAETGGPCDLLGKVFHALELHNKYHGQFFTPFHICEFMGQVALADGGEAGNIASEALYKKGYLSVCEPCVGSGGMVLGFAKAMHNNKMNYCDQMVAYCCDIDIKCVHMAYLQLSLYGIPAVIIHGNSLTNEEWSRWYTPVYMINGWPMRERVENLLETIQEATQDRPAVKPEEIPSEIAEDFTPETEIKEYEQIAIF
ncbi:MAG: N-6 DNA methylase [Acutalibacteraceae bacterium]|nr:N-6 DNA methylase [Acutalibacteraceae bacterium]